MDRREEVLSFALERQRVHLRRAAGLPREEWTADPVLREYRFTNVYRELDRHTAWVREHVREPHADSCWLMPAVLLARIFNRVPVMEAIFLDPPNPWTTVRWLAEEGDPDIAPDPMAPVAVELRRRWPRGPWVTGVYMIKTPTGMDKLDGTAHIVQQFVLGRGRPGAKPEHWRTIDADLRGAGRGARTLEEVHSWLLQYHYMGPFLAAQIVADLKHTPLLREAPDWWTWAAPGPGSLTGMNVMRGRPPGRTIHHRQWRAELDDLRPWLSAAMERHGHPPLCAQDAQNVLCEYSKWTRGWTRNRFEPHGEAR